MKKLANSVVVLLVICYCWVLPGATLTAQSRQTQSGGKYAAKLSLFEQFVKERMAKDKIPGLTIGFKKDDVTWVKGFGYADVENRIPAKAESAYRLASITKTMTGTAILQLVERGKIDLDAAIQTYVPYYPKQKWPVTVRQLLVHLGGGQTGSGIGPEYVTPREVVERIAKYPIKNEPGVKFDYQTSGYNLLGAAIEEVTGKSFGEYLRENIWTPIGMKDTRMDNVREMIPNRVRGYELVKGEIKNAPFLDVSSRFGGGGANGTVPDLLRWASSVLHSGILTKPSIDLMFTPVANKSGHYVGIDNDAWHYTLGWQVFPLNGQLVIYNDGGQIGTNTMVLHIPSENLSIAFACNLQDIDRMPYVKELYYAVTDRSWDLRVYTKDKIDAAVYRGMSETFDHGSLHYDQFNSPVSSNPEALARAFTYFNQTVSRASLEAALAEGVTAINDGRHPVADTAFIKVGSYMAMQLREKYGVARSSGYRTMGAIPFFADYIEIYKTTANYPKELQFSDVFEKTVARWNRDWPRTWNAYTRHFSPASSSDLNVLQDRLSKMFSGAEVYPNLIGPLLGLRQSYESQKDWEKAAKAAMIAAELYPQSDTTNTNYAISLIILGKRDEARVSLKKASGINANGIASAKAVNQIALALARIDKPAAGMEWLKIAVQIYPRDAALYGSLGDFYQKQGQRKQAIESYRKALELDSNYEHAKEALTINNKIK